MPECPGFLQGPRKWSRMARSLSPLSIRLDQKLLLPAKQILLPQPLTERIPDESILLNRLSAGDQVILLRAQGGQKYVLLGRISL